MRPADVARALLKALDASEGRRKRRMRDTTPDAIGQSLERDLLEEVAREDPDPGAFEGWLSERCRAAGFSSGPIRAVASKVLEEWKMTHASPEFRAWLLSGARSDDAEMKVFQLRQRRVLYVNQLARRLSKPLEQECSL